MSITVTIELQQWVCGELEHMRKMIKTHDFSGLDAALERTQHHVNTMESALERATHIRGHLQSKEEDIRGDDADLRADAIAKLYEILTDPNAW